MPNDGSINIESLDEDNLQVNITFSKLGTYTIYCNSSDGSQISESCFLTINKNSIKSITLSSKSEEYTIGESFNISAKIFPEDAVASKIEWTSSPNTLEKYFKINNDILTIDTSSLSANSKMEGSYIITCKATDSRTEKLITEDYNLYLKPAASTEETISSHIATLRGENLIGEEHFQSIDKLAEYVKAGNFEDIYIGDYITITMPIINDITISDTLNQEVNLVVMDINYLIGKGDIPLLKPHLLFMPADCIGAGKMNTTNTNNGGYIASYMHTTLMPIYEKQLKKILGENNIITYRDQLSTDRSSGVQWADVTLKLANEYSIFNSRSYSNAAQDGDYNKQLAGFTLSADLKKKTTSSNLSVYNVNIWFTSSVNKNNTTSWVGVSATGTDSSKNANRDFGIVPIIVFG